MIYYPLRSRLKYKHDFYKYLCENDFLTLLMINFLFLFIKNAKNDIKVRQSMIRLLKIDPKSPFFKIFSFVLHILHALNLSYMYPHKTQCLHAISYVKRFAYGET